MARTDSTHVAVSRSGEFAVLDANGRERERHRVPYGAVLAVVDGAKVQPGQVVANWDPHTHPVISEVTGRVQFRDVIDGVTVQRQIDDLTGFESLQVLDVKQRSAVGADLRPTVLLIDDEGSELTLPGTDIPAQYALPVGAMLNIGDGARIEVGDVIARPAPGIVQDPGHHRRPAAGRGPLRSPPSQGAFGPRRAERGGELRPGDQGQAAYRHYRR